VKEHNFQRPVTDLTACQQLLTTLNERSCRDGDIPVTPNCPHEHRDKRDDQEDSPMKTRTLLIAAAILTTVGAPLGLLAATGELTANGEVAAMSLGPPAQVDVATVLLKPVQRWDDFNGRISVAGSVEIRSRVSV
jgi:hypothetical protein